MYPTHSQRPLCTRDAFTWRLFLRTLSWEDLKWGWWCKECKRIFSSLSMIRNLAFEVLRTHQSLTWLKVGGGLLPSNWSFVEGNDLQVTFATFSIASIVGIHGINSSDHLMFFQILSSTLGWNSFHGKIRSFRLPFWKRTISFIPLCCDLICRIRNFFESFARFAQISILKYCIGSHNFILSLWLSYHSQLIFFKIPLSWCWSNLKFNEFFYEKFHSICLMWLMSFLYSKVFIFFT